MLIRFLPVTQVLKYTVDNPQFIFNVLSGNQAAFPQFMLKKVTVKINLNLPKVEALGLFLCCVLGFAPPPSVIEPGPFVKSASGSKPTPLHRSSTFFLRS
jgi:hypothetical protein